MKPSLLDALYQDLQIVSNASASTDMKTNDLPHPGTHDKTVIRIDFDDSIVDEDGQVKSLDLGVARLADVKQTQLAGFGASWEAGSQSSSSAGVGAVDDEGFVGEFCSNISWVNFTFGSGLNHTVVDAGRLVLRSKNLKAGFDIAVVAAGSVREINRCL